MIDVVASSEAIEAPAKTDEELYEKLQRWIGGTVLLSDAPYGINYQRGDERVGVLAGLVHERSSNRFYAIFQSFQNPVQLAHCDFVGALSSDGWRIVNRGENAPLPRWAQQQEQL